MSLRRTLVLVLMLSCFTQPGITSAAQSAGNLKKNSYFIQGAVKKPGVYPIDGAASVFKLITLAGGLSDRHASIAFIIRLSTQQNERTSSNFVPGNEYIVIRIDISGFLKGEVQNDVVLTAGDILNIPITDDFVLPNSRPGVTTAVSGHSADSVSRALPGRSSMPGAARTREASYGIKPKLIALLDQ